MNHKTKTVLRSLALAGGVASYHRVKKYSPLAHPLFTYVLKQVIRDDGRKTYAIEYHFKRPLNTYVKADEVLMMRGHHMEKARRVNYGLSYIRFEFTPFDSEQDFEIQSRYRWLNVSKDDITNISIDELKGFEPHYYFKKSSQELDLASRLFKPQGAKGKKYPLVVFLHDARGCGQDNLSSLTIDRSIFSFSTDLAQKERPCYIYVPQLPVDASWASPQAIASLLHDLEHILAAHPDIDRQRIYLAGNREGGQGAYYFLAQHTDLFAGAILSEMSGLADFTSRLMKMPIWFIDEKDKTIKPYYREEVTGKVLSAQLPLSHYSNKVQTAYPHEVLTWLFNQSKEEVNDEI